MTGKFSTVGEYLRQTRNERGISLEQVAQATRVKLAYLQAIELDTPTDLPSVVQARGFLRLYASYLNLPVQPLLDGWQKGQFHLDEDSAGIEGESDQAISEQEPNEPAGLEPDSGHPSEVEAAEVESTPEWGELESDPVLPAQDDDGVPVEEAIGIDQLQSQEIFNLIGQQLRERREALSLSVADIERFTRLREYYIQALEDGRVRDLPSMVQGRGMLNNYAEFLDLDAEGLMLQFAEALQTRRLELATPVNDSAQKRSLSSFSGKSNRGTPAWRRFLTLDLVLGGGLFIFLIIFVVWGAARVTDLRRTSQEPTAPSISEMLMTPDTNLASPTPDQTTTVTPMQAEANPIDPNTIGLVPTATGDITIPTLGSNPISVYIVALQRAWMRITVDTSVVFEGRVVPGNAYPFTGRERIDLLTGSAGALTVIYNENNLGTLGAVGEVVSMSFTREGMSVPTPDATSTSTPTQQPSATLQPTPTSPTPSVTPLVP